MLVIGGSFSGLAAGRDLANHFLVTIIDAKAPFRAWASQRPFLPLLRSSSSTLLVCCAPM